MFDLFRRLKLKFRWNKTKPKLNDLNLGLLVKVKLSFDLFTDLTKPDVSLVNCSKYQIIAPVHNLYTLIHTLNDHKISFINSGYAASINNDVLEQYRLDRWFLSNSHIFEYGDIDLFTAWQMVTNIIKEILVLVEKNQLTETYLERKCYTQLKTYIILTQTLGKMIYE